MSRILIDNNTGHPDDQIVELVAKVIKAGRVSGKPGKEAYCYCTTFRHLDVMITSKRNKASDAFIANDAMGLVTFVRMDKEGNLESN